MELPMFWKESKNKTYRFEINDFRFGKFIVNIVEITDDLCTTYEAWLSMPKYGVSDFMFGVPKSQYTPNIESFIDLVDCNLPPYMRMYINDHAEM